MYKANLDLGILWETKITDGFYTCRFFIYSVVTTYVPNQHRRGVAVFYWSSMWLAVEAIHKFGPNVASFQLASGEQRWYIIRCYLTPDNAQTIDCVVAKLRERPQVSELVVAVDFSAYLAQPEGVSIEVEITEALMSAVLEYMLVYFMPQRRP